MRNRLSKDWRITIAFALGLVVAAGAGIHLLLSSGTKGTLRAFGYEGRWANDCAKTPSALLSGGNLEARHEIPLFGPATSSAYYGARAPIESTITKARMVTNDKLWVEMENISPMDKSRPGMALYRRFITKVYTKVGDRLQVLDSQAKFVITKSGANPFDSNSGMWKGEQNLSKGETATAVGINDGWWVSPDGEKIAPVKPFERCTN